MITVRLYISPDRLPTMWAPSPGEVVVKLLAFLLHVLHHGSNHPRNAPECTVCKRSISNLLYKMGQDFLDIQYTKELK